MKKKIILIVTGLLISLQAICGYIDLNPQQRIYFSFDENTQSISICSPTSTGWTGYPTPIGDLIIPDSIEHNGNTYPVTIIYPNAFKQCYMLTSVTIPNTVTTIWGGAFDGCDSIISFSIGSGVTYIGNNIFNKKKCSYLVVSSDNTVYDSRNNCNAIIETASNTLLIGCKNTVIPPSVTSIASRAFFYCSELSSINIPNSITHINDDAFLGCSSLSTITIPRSLTYLGLRAFYGCENLSTVSFNAENCSTMAINVSSFLPFAECNNISHFIFGEHVKVIPSRVCSCLQNLTHVVIPDSVTTIDDFAFANCIGLNAVSIGHGVTAINRLAFQGCNSLPSITIPDNVTFLGDSAFLGCGSMTSVNIGRGITSIGDGVFANCYSLPSINIPDGITSIGDLAFGNNDYLTDIFFGRGVTTLGQRILSGCIHLSKIHMRGVTPPTAQSNTFANIPSTATLRVPCDAAPTYQNTSFWNQLPTEEEFTYSFRATPDHSSHGIVQVLRQPDCDNNEAEVQATPFLSYHFEQWSDGNTEPHRFLAVVQDTAIQAIFAVGSTESIEEPGKTNHPIHIAVTEGHIKVSLDGRPVDEFRIYDLIGREVSKTQPAAGVYLVKVGSLPAQKVIIY